MLGVYTYLCNFIIVVEKVCDVFVGFLVCFWMYFWNVYVRFFLAINRESMRLLLAVFDRRMSGLGEQVLVAWVDVFGSGVCLA